MTRSLLLAATALTLSSAIALAQNAPASGSANDGARAPAKVQRVARERSAMPARPLYDYVAVVPSPSPITGMPFLYGVAY